MTRAVSRARAVLVMTRSGYVRVSTAGRTALTVGRGIDCDVTVDDATLAAHQATLHLVPWLAIEELGGGGGVRVAGARIERGQRVALECGQEVVVGDTSLVVLGEPTVGEAGARAVVRDPRMVEIRDELVRFARGDLGIMLLGETGVGKEVLAELVHTCSRRAGGRFMRINCAAISESLADSELFGHERSAFSPVALARLQQFSWPGNVRQLANVIERAVTRCGAAIAVGDLDLEAAAVRRRVTPPRIPTLDERQRIAAALEFAAGNQGDAARLLGISRRTLSKRLDEYRLPRPRKR